VSSSVHRDAADEVAFDAMGSGSPRDFYTVLFRYKWKSLLFFVVVVAVVAAGTFAVHPKYDSEAKLMVKPGRESLAVDPTVPEGRMVSIDRKMGEELNSELEILKSRVLVEKVVDAIGPEQFLAAGDEQNRQAAAGSVPRKVLRKVSGALSSAFGHLVESLGLVDALPPREKAIRQVTEGLDVQVMKDTNILDVTFRAKSPALAEGTLNKLIDAYLDHHVQVHQTGSSYDFFKEQATKLETELTAAEEELRSFKNATGVAALNEQRTVLIRRIDELEGKTQDVETRLAASRATVSSLESTLAHLPQTATLEQDTGGQNFFMDNARIRLMELRLQEKELRGKYPETSPLVTTVREQIRQAESMLAGQEETRTEVKTGISVSYQQLQTALLQEKASVSASEGQQRTLSGQIDTTKAELKALNDNETKLAQLDRRRDISERNYRSYVDRLEEARTSRALEQEKISNIAVVQPATTPVTPASPKKLLLLFLAVFLGLFGGIGLAFLSEYLDHSLRTGEDVEKKLEIPVLVSIPKAKAALFKTQSRAILGEGKQKGNDTTPLGPRPYSYTLRDRVLGSMNGRAGGGKCLVVTSCHGGEGVSSVALGLAVAFAEAKRGGVLLVDTNVNASMTDESFGLGQGDGLTEAVVGRSTAISAVRKTRIPSLDVLPAGAHPMVLSHLAGPDRFIEMLPELKSTYSLLVLDAPPVLDCGATARLAGMADGTLLVIEAERERWEVAQKATSLLQSAGAQVLGAVLNKRRFYIPGWLYRRLL
jgi:capsular exopolysaccharide synthesis family protein